MSTFGRQFMVVAFAAVLFAAPLAAHALGISVGGRIIALTPCVSPLGPSIWLTVLSARATDPLVPEPYIWTPLTFRTLVPPTPTLPPPTHIGQQILGIADLPFTCFVGFVPLYGLRLQIGNASLL